MPGVDVSCLTELSSTFWIDYVDGARRTRVFNYDASTGLYTTLAAASGLCSIAVVSLTMQFLIGATVVMTYTTAGAVVVGAYSYIPTPISPRLEFMRFRGGSPQRLGSIDSGKTFSAADLYEAVIPVGNDQFKFGANAALAPRGLFCDSLSEIL